MPRWFPRADNKAGVNKALFVGCVGALIVVGIDAYHIVERALHYQQYSDPRLRGLEPLLLIGPIAVALVPLTAAWRFAIGKGLAWGSVVLLLVLVPLVIDLFMGMTSANIAWVIARFLGAAALIVGIRGAWTARSPVLRQDYAEVFE